MDRIKHLQKACKAEKDANTAVRMTAVLMVLRQGLGTTQTAATIGCSENSVRNWLKRFDKRGVDGLRDNPRSGRPSKVDKKKIDRIFSNVAKNSIRPAEATEMIRKKTGVKYHVGHVRHMMHQRNLPLKPSRGHMQGSRHPRRMRVTTAP